MEGPCNNLEFLLESEHPTLPSLPAPPPRRCDVGNEQRMVQGNFEYNIHTHIYAGCWKWTYGRKVASFKKVQHPIIYKLVIARCCQRSLLVLKYLTFTIGQQPQQMYTFWKLHIKDNIFGRIQLATQQNATCRPPLDFPNPNIFLKISAYRFSKSNNILIW